MVYKKTPSNKDDILIANQESVTHINTEYRLKLLKFISAISGAVEKAGEGATKN